MHDLVSSGQCVSAWFLMSFKASKVLQANSLVQSSSLAESKSVPDLHYKKGTESHTAPQTGLWVIRWNRALTWNSRSDEQEGEGDPGMRKGDRDRSGGHGREREKQRDKFRMCDTKKKNRIESGWVWNIQSWRIYMDVSVNPLRAEVSFKQIVFCPLLFFLHTPKPIHNWSILREL